MLNSAYTASELSLFLTLPSLSLSNLRVDKNVGGSTAGTASPSWPRDIPYCVTLRSAIKLGRSLPGIAVWRLAGQWLFGGELFVSLVYTVLFSLFFYLLNCLYLKPCVFSLLFFQFCSLSHWVGSQWAALWCSAAYQD